MRYFRIFIFIGAIAVYLVLPGYTQEVLTWDDCISESLKTHPDLISAQETIRQARSDRDIVRSRMLTQFASQMSARTSKSNGETQDSYSYGVTGEQLLFDGNKISSDIKVADQTVTAQTYGYAVTSSNVRLALRDAFIALLRAQELVPLTEAIAKRRKENLDLVQLRYDAGREHKGALYTAQADLAQAEFEVDQARRDVSLAQSQLIKELGRTQRTIDMSVTGDFTVSEGNGPTPDFTYLADNTPLLQQLIAKKDAARFNVQSAQADFFPQVYVNTSAARSSSKWPPEDDQWGVGVSVSFPLFEGGSRIAQVAKRQSALTQARADERSGRDTVLVTLEETWTDLADSIGTVGVKEKFLAAAQERAKIASAQYSTGLISFDDWIIIENNLVNAKKDFLNARANMLVSEARWIQAKGGTLEYDRN
ncbi:MAG: TolC family protein [Candidatus Omnitrophica bacterium]|nr:TolC family protein [Candidatus Omnitrophota bacterium]